MKERVNQLVMVKCDQPDREAWWQSMCQSPEMSWNSHGACVIKCLFDAKMNKNIFSQWHERAESMIGPLVSPVLWLVNGIFQ